MHARLEIHAIHLILSLVRTRTATDLAMCIIGKRDGGLAHVLRTKLTWRSIIMIRKGDVAI